VYVSAYKQGDNVVIVAVNRSTVSKTLTFSIPNTKVEEWTPYVTSGSKNVEKGEPISAPDESFLITLEPQSTTTFVGKAPNNEEPVVPEVQGPY
jgi:glucuronoarabinoxylan endo-1,4-beta-xylanase